MVFIVLTLIYFIIIYYILTQRTHLYISNFNSLPRAWSSVVVKALRY